MSAPVRLPIYLDYQSTTPVDPSVLAGMLPYFSEKFGNPSSKSHELGWAAEAAVENARKQVAALLGSEESEVLFTSGATESINLAIQGVIQAYRDRGNHIITTLTEHKAVLDVCRHLETQGARVTYLRPDQFGRVDIKQIQDAIEPRTVLISVIAANNEIGTLNPMREIGVLAKAHQILFHSDATQAVGKIPVRVADWQVDLLSFNAHKIYGPKGVGALYYRRKNPRVSLTPIIHGGGHERGLRSGTLNVPGIVGLGKAAELAGKCLKEDAARIRGMRDELQKGFENELEGVHIHGHPEFRLGENLSVAFDGVDSQALMMALREIAVSAGSACMSASAEPSHVLKAIGVSDSLARNTIRISLGRPTLEPEMRYAMMRIIEKVREFRQTSIIGE